MNNIKKIRTSKFIKQYELAKSVGITKAGMNFIENGKVKYIRPSVLKKISVELDTSPIYLLGEDNVIYAPQSIEEVDYLISIFNKMRKELVRSREANIGYDSKKVCYLKAKEALGNNDYHLHSAYYNSNSYLFIFVSLNTQKEVLKPIEVFVSEQTLEVRLDYDKLVNFKEAIPISIKELVEI